MEKKGFTSCFAAAVKEIRLQKKLTIEQLADKAAVHRTTIGLIERNERVPTIQIAKRISEALDMNLSELIEITEKKERS
ncbi:MULTISPECIES: helix-turn-helix domain-containing protein [Erwiniaceae]|jgi:transcriptional regulator with XRE-family HTH domain|uniref:helix-turn-helix domain-containing protein n=1 Tax=Erwiniaceae TaxID=1903409 RepID=UPI003FD677FD